MRLYTCVKCEKLSYPTLAAMTPTGSRVAVSSSRAGAGNAIMAQLPSTGLKMAVAVLGAAPMLMLFPFFMKYFVKGITVGAVKG